jgi:iron(III) transport system permease protein
MAGVAAVAFGSVVALPLALLVARYDFPGRALIQTLSLLPLVIPPFVGAVAFQQILGGSGVVNLFLLDTFGAGIPFMEGLAGIVLVQTLHYFPCILVNPAATLQGADPASEEAAQMLAPTAGDCSAGSRCRWPCPASWRARCSRSSGSSTTSAPR